MGSNMTLQTFKAPTMALALAQVKSVIITNSQLIDKCAVLENHRVFLADPLQFLFGIISNVFGSDNHPPGIWFEKSHDVV